MSKVREVERVIIERGESHDVAPVHFVQRRIQVRRGVPLPDLGQRVVVMDEHRMVKFAGEVIEVDFEDHTYDVKLRKSFRRIV
jgi:hypothetical protein